MPGESHNNADRPLESGARFAFGENWARFLASVGESEIEAAQAALEKSLGPGFLRGRSFLDIGSGSGLSSLAARRLGANVHSFDFDADSVACTEELKRRYFAEDSKWMIEQGSVLDSQYVASLGEFDIVYSWGVLHHTGAMWLAFENSMKCVALNSGTLLVAIYNDQGWKSHVWWLVKLVYNRLPRFLRSPYAFSFNAMTRFMVLIKYTLLLRPMVALRPMLSRRRERGMSARFDVLDWIGGFPYEFASLDTLRAYFDARGFELVAALPSTSLGCNELVLRRRPASETDVT